MTPTPLTMLIEKARAVRVEDECARRGIKLRGRGVDRCGACPACGGDDRFAIHVKKQIFNCRGFGGGDIIDMVRHIDKCDVVTAVYTLTGEPRPNGGSNALTLAIAKKKARAALDAPNNVTRKITAATHEYVDEDGVVVYAVDRVEYQNADGSPVLKDGKPKKIFRQRRADPNRPGAWIANIDGATRIPYRLPELIEAVASNQMIFVVEGEACVNALREIGITATTNSGGAGKWDISFNEYLRGADVVLLPDNDEAGQKHVDDIAASLVGIAARTRILTLPNLPPKGDVVDWLTNGSTREQLDALVETAADWQPPTEATVDEQCTWATPRNAMCRSAALRPTAASRLKRIETICYSILVHGH